MQPTAGALPILSMLLQPSTRRRGQLKSKRDEHVANHSWATVERYAVQSTISRTVWVDVVNGLPHYCGSIVSRAMPLESWDCEMDDLGRACERRRSRCKFEVATVVHHECYILTLIASYSVMAPPAV